jgi:ABC-type bacteriocin/lantibiotic exporter with double-glycine peptidase domain
VKNIFVILSSKEKSKVIKLIFLDILMSILDISFLAMLLFVIKFYTQEHLVSSFNFPINFINKNPLSLVIIFFIFFSLKNYFGFYVIRMQLKFIYEVASRLSKKNIANYLNGNYTDYVSIDSSVHIRRISQQPIEFCHYVLGGFQQIVSQSLLILVTIFAIVIYDPVLFPLLFFILAPPIILIGFLMRKKLNRIRKTAKTVSEKSIQYLKESLSAFVESNLYDSKTFFASRYHAAQSKFNNILSEQLVIQNLPSRLIEIFAILGLFILILINSFTTKTNSIPLITLGAFMAAAYKIIPGIVKILNSSGQIKTYEFTIEDLLQNNSIHFKKMTQNIHELQSVVLKNVSFNFKKELVLNNFSFTISQGDFIGLSGISGKGKTTMINLLLGILKPSQGSILVNGIYTGNEERQQFWKNIGYVKQQPLLIYDSILKNITLNENDVDFQKMEEVIRVAGLKELIDNYAEGYNKIITENGRNLSGGQRQRIAIARALYKESDLIILDEPFSELDWLSEERLLNHFSELANAGKMIILITHHKESLSFCNKIISLDEKQPAGFSDLDARLS